MRYKIGLLETVGNLHLSHCFYPPPISLALVHPGRHPAHATTDATPDLRHCLHSVAKTQNTRNNTDVPAKLRSGGTRNANVKPLEQRINQMTRVTRKATRTNGTSGIGKRATDGFLLGKREQEKE